MRIFGANIVFFYSLASLLLALTACAAPQTPNKPYPTTSAPSPSPQANRPANPELTSLTFAPQRASITPAMHHPIDEAALLAHAFPWKRLQLTASTDASDISPTDPGLRPLLGIARAQRVTVEFMLRGIPRSNIDIVVLPPDSGEYDTIDGNNRRVRIAFSNKTP